MVLARDLVSRPAPPARRAETPRAFALPFPRAEYEDRQRRLRAAMVEAGLDAVIITSHMDGYWFTGSRVDFTAAESPQWVIVSPDRDPVAVVRHLEAATFRCCSFVTELAIYYDEGPINPYDPVKATAEQLARMGLARARIGLPHRTTSAEDYLRFRELLPEASFAPFSIANVRARRSAAELACFREAASVNQHALMHTIEAMQPGMSEWRVLKDIARRHARLLGTDYFRSAMGATCCQVGRHMMHMHAIRTPREMRNKKIRPGDGAWLEPGVFVKEYVGSMLRTIWFGEPPAAVRRAMDATVEAFELLLESIGPGKQAQEVDGAVRRHLAARGYGIDSYQHRAGYTSSEKWLDGGVLSLTPGNPLVLRPGHVFHCPVHVYVPGYGYMGVSEQIVITETGHEVLGDHERSCPRKLFVKEHDAGGRWELA